MWKRCVTQNIHTFYVNIELTVVKCAALKGTAYSSSPQPSGHQGPVSQKTIVP